MYINPLSLSVHILRFSACRRAQMSQNTLKGSFPCVIIRWFNDILFLPYFKIGEYIGILFMKIQKSENVYSMIITIADMELT